MWGAGRQYITRSNRVEVWKGGNACLVYVRIAILKLGNITLGPFTEGRNLETKISL